MSFEAFGLEPKHINGVYQSRTGLNYTFLFFYEKKFFNDDYVETKRTWMTNNWHLSIIYAFVYIIAIFLGQMLMKSREKFDLRRALVAWNFVLGLFSLVGALRVWPEFIYTVYTKGFEHSMCSTDYTHGVSGCWAWLFILSKVPELVDTLFIVLRKQELIFLHWYHHATVLIYCWFSCRDFSASGRWFVLMNYTVHAVMYSYYAFRAMRFQIPKWVNIAITSGQISQMVFGIYVNTVAYMKKRRGEACDVSDENIKWSFIMYFSYFLLFFNFFYNTYISPKNKKRTGQAPVSSNGKTVNGVYHKLAENGTNGHVKHSNGNGYDQNNNKKLS
jgi:elongation of very long chain fatty acids protein 6